MRTKRTESRKTKRKKENVLNQNSLGSGSREEREREETLFSLCVNCLYLLMFGEAGLRSLFVSIMFYTVHQPVFVVYRAVEVLSG
jgi:hypothetical protein